MEKNKEIKILEDKKVFVRAFDKTRAFYSDNHDGRIRFTGCSVGYKLPWETSARRFVNIFKDGEQEAFEKALDLEPGSLNLYKRKKSWFSEFNVELTKETTELDLSSPIQSLEYRVLLANKDHISPSKSDYNGTQDYYIEDESVSETESYKLAEKREDAMELFMKIRKSDKNMYDLLRVLGKNPPKSMATNTKALKAEIDSIINETKKLNGIPNIDDFLYTAKDALFKDKIFVKDAIDIGEIEVVDGAYKMKESGQPLGRSLNETAEYFNAAKNQDDKLLIQQRIELNKGN